MTLKVFDNGCKLHRKEIIYMVSYKMRQEGHAHRAQTAIGIIGTSAYLGDVNWKLLLSACTLAGLVSMLKSVLIGIPESNV